MAWNTPLSAPITLRSGEVLQTLGDAARALVQMCEGLTKSEIASAAGELLLAAVETGRPEDIDAATLRMKLFLASRAALPAVYRPARAVGRRR